MANDMQQWLEALDLGRYATVFAEHEITLRELPDLTDAELREIGLPLGPRKRLLRAIAELSPASAARQDERKAAPIGPSESSVADNAPRFEPERRQLTVLFCDLVDSTALSRRLDPEDLHQVLGRYQDVCAEAVARFDGYLAKFLGDGVLVYFGYPRAHEDDAERAIRAASSMVEAVGAIEAGGRLLAARAGIATGLVVVGDITGATTRSEADVVGETPNLAARLQAAAPPGAVIVAETTRRLAGGVFDYATLGEMDLKGLGRSVAAFRVMGERRSETRYEARAAPRAQLIGRQQEVGLLLDRWHSAQAGEGQLVLLSGEPGIGKSRIVHALRERIAEGPHWRLSYQCLPLHANTALHPVIEQLERAAGFLREDTSATRLDKLEALLSAAGEPVAPHAAVLANLLGIPQDGRYPPLDLTPEQIKRVTLDALAAQLLALASRRPVLMVVEDVHWADPSTLELLGRTIEAIQSARVLLLATHRPEFRPPWTGYAHATQLALNRLGRGQVGELLGQLTGGKALPADLVEHILAKTDGVPLFVEELVKSVLESELVRQENGRYALAGPLSAIAIPSTLHDSLMARLDRLAPAREVAQIGACIGREFPYDLLAAVDGRPEGELHRALDELVGAELVFGRGSPPEASYSFKHALVQDTAYGSLMKARRQELHGRIADALEARFPAVVEVKPELAAQHLTAAGKAERAIPYWLRAAQRAARRSANFEAAGHLRAGLELVRARPPGAERAASELSLLIELGPALMVTQGWDAPEVRETYARAMRLAEETGRYAELFPVLWGRWLVAHAGGDAETARELLRELFRLIEDRDDPDLRLQARHAGASTFCTDGNLLDAQRHVDDGIALYSLERHRGQALRYGGHDPCVCIGSIGALNQLMLGHLDRAREYSDRALALSAEVGHAPSVAHAEWYRAELLHILGERAPAEALARSVLRLAAEKGLAHYAAWARMMLGWALARRGDAGAGVTEMEEGFADLRGVGIRYHFPHRLGVRAQTYAAAGHAAALDAADEAIRSVASTGERWYEAELHRLKAAILLARAQPDHAFAEACLDQAIAVARAQGARFWELRAARDLAKLRLGQGRRADAASLLRPIYGWFSEGLAMPEMIEVKRLLDGLA